MDIKISSNRVNLWLVEKKSFLYAVNPGSSRAWSSSVPGTKEKEIIKKKLPKSIVTEFQFLFQQFLTWKGNEFNDHPISHVVLYWCEGCMPHILSEWNVLSLTTPNSTFFKTKELNSIHIFREILLIELCLDRLIKCQESAEYMAFYCKKFRTQLEHLIHPVVELCMSKLSIVICACCTFTFYSRSRLAIGNSISNTVITHYMIDQTCAPSPSPQPKRIYMPCRSCSFFEHVD